MELIYITPVIRNPKLMQGLTGEELEQRRESHLNTYFNARKNKLKEITKVNKKIYVRINSQKSLYSSRDLDKSYESTSQLSRRLSQSKLSRNSNTSLSRVSSRAKKARPSKVEKKVII